MRKTTNYGLALYDLEDKMSITAEEDSLNANMEIIDSTLKEKATINNMTTYIEEHKDELKGADGTNGINGKDGYTPVKGVDYFDGKDGTNGKDGVSVTHSWNGTTLTVTSASGTSSANLKGDTGATGSKGEDGKDYVLTETDKEDISKLVEVNIPTKVSQLENDKNYVPIEEVEEIAINALGTETLPSPNLVNINDTESWPFGISETEAIKGLYSWIDSEGYINIRGTATENCSLFLMFEEGDITFEAGTYYIGFDDMLRTGTQSVVVQFNDNYKVYTNSGDESPTATITLTENLTVKKIDLVFNSGAIIDFRGHCWITKDEPIDFYVPKGGSYKIPITPAKREDFEKLDDYNILGIFDSIGGVGDSLTSGYINTTDDANYVDTTCYPKSWLTQLKKITGVDITHYSYQGATAKNWMQNQNSFYEKIIETPHEAYFLALGTNDSSDWSGYGLGTIADMGTDTESFYGWYSKVIARIRTANPKAPIFMLSMYWTGFPTYNQAIQEMANATENAYYIDITDMNDKYSQYRQGYHFNAIGYYYIAQNIIKRTSDVIIKNHQAFANLGVEEQEG